MEAFKQETLDYNYDWSCWFDERDMEVFDEDQWKEWLDNHPEGAHLSICAKYREHRCLRWRWFVFKDGLEQPLEGTEWTDCYIL